MYAYGWREHVMFRSQLVLPPHQSLLCVDRQFVAVAERPVDGRDVRVPWGGRPAVASDVPDTHTCSTHPYSEKRARASSAEDCHCVGRWRCIYSLVKSSSHRWGVARGALGSSVSVIMASETREVSSTHRHACSRRQDQWGGRMRCNRDRTARELGGRVRRDHSEEGTLGACWACRPQTTVK